MTRGPRPSPGKDGNFTVDCDSFPRCAGCAELDECDTCGTSVCVWVVGGIFSGDEDGGLLCKECREIERVVQLR